MDEHQITAIIVIPIMVAFFMWVDNRIEKWKERKKK